MTDINKQDIDSRELNIALCGIIKYGEPTVRERAIQVLSRRGKDLTMSDLGILVAYDRKHAEKWGRKLNISVEYYISHPSGSMNELPVYLEPIFARVTCDWVRARAGQLILDMPAGIGRDHYAMVAREVPELQGVAVKRIVELGVMNIFDVYAVWPFCTDEQKKTVWHAFEPSFDDKTKTRCVKILREDKFDDLTDLAFERLRSPLKAIDWADELFTIASVCERFLDWSKTQKPYIDFLWKAVKNSSLVKEKAWGLLKKEKSHTWYIKLRTLIEVPMCKAPDYTWARERAFDEIVDGATSIEELSFLFQFNNKSVTEEAARKVLRLIAESSEPAPELQPVSATATTASN